MKLNNIIKFLIALIIFQVDVFGIIAQDKDEIYPSWEGLVINQAGVPLHGVKVSHPIDFKEVITDDAGKFKIDVPDDGIIYFVKDGYITQKKELNNPDNSITIILELAPNDKIYNIGYDNYSASELTTAISIIDSKSLTQGMPTFFENALAGKAAGLSVLKNLNRGPGYESSNMFVRGIGTENAMNSPYVLVDDIERGLGKLDINEIESVTILKDGAANAKYGQRGANGTILVATKRGFIGKTEIYFISQWGIQQPTNLPNFLGSYDYLNVYRKALMSDGLSIPSGSKYNPEMYDGSHDPLRFPNVNWYDNFLRKNSFQQQYKLMLRGGTEVVRFFVLMGYLNQQGLYKHTNLNSSYNTNLVYDRFNLRSNIDANVTKTLVVSLDLAGSVEMNNLPNSATTDIFSTLSSLTPNAMPIQYSSEMLAGTSHYKNNPMGMISRTGYRSDRAISFQLKAKAVQKLDIITHGLAADLSFGYDGNALYGLAKTANYATYELQEDGNYIKYGEDKPISLGMEVSTKGYYYLMSLFGGLTYQRKFENHSVGANVRYYQAQTHIQGDNPPFGKQGINGGIRYNYNNKYYAEASFSYDGSDEFAPGHRFGFFPAVSAAWLISNEDFLKYNTTLTSLKLRASYGEAGNCKTASLNRYAYQPHWTAQEGGAWGGGYQFGSGSTWYDGAWEGRIANPDLTWERTRNYNIGIDFSLFNKLSVNIDGFIHNRDNIILSLENTNSWVVGAPSPYANAGEVTNKGVEFTLGYNEKIGNVEFFVQGNISFAKNKIRKTDELDELPDNLKRAGYSISQLWGMQAEGFYKDQNDINTSPYNTLYKVRPGDIKYTDINGDKIINSLDEVPVGSPTHPQWTMGLSAGFNFKGFDLSFVLSGYAGRSVYLNNSAVWNLQNNGNATNLVYGAWEAGVREDNATYPRLTTETNKNNYRSSSFWIKNGDFLRLSNVEIGYSLPHNIINRVHMKELRVYVNGQNLCSLDHLGSYNLDPEVINAGITGYPNMRTFNFGLSVKF